MSSTRRLLNPYTEMLRDANAGAAQLDFYESCLVTEMKGCLDPDGSRCVISRPRTRPRRVGASFRSNHPVMFAAAIPGRRSRPQHRRAQPAEQAPLSALRLAETDRRILPPRVWHVVPVEGKEVWPCAGSPPDIAITALIRPCRPGGRAVNEGGIRYL